LNVDDTNLVVSGSVDTNSEKIIEIIEYTGKDFIIGFQFHPEAAVVNHIQGADNAADLMDCETALHRFEALIDSLSSQ
jgi:CTP synthase (UTP-ammonia lyase)